MFMAILAIILTLILVVGIHEAGHAIAARIFNVNIKKISIGFGKPLAQWQSPNGWHWVWAMWPLGGYVQLLNSRISPVDVSEYPHCFDKQPIWIRLIILLAGAFANLLTACLAFIIVYYVGITYKMPQVTSVVPKSVAAHAGISPGDQFIAINGEATPSWHEVGMQLVILWGNKDLKLVLKPANSAELKQVILDLSQVPFQAKDRSLLASLGINPNLNATDGLMRASSFTDAIVHSYYAVVHTVYFFLMILKKLLSGIIPFSMLLGPLGIFVVSITSLSQGVIVFFYFIATLSLAVALINLFPIPGLDGGSIFYLFLEKLKGKPVSVAMEVLLHRLIVIVFCVVLVHLLMNDVNRFF